MFNIFKRKGKQQDDSPNISQTNGQTSQQLLELLVEHLKPVLKGFEYQSGQTATSSGGSFANGFFENEKIKIGLIFRGVNLGLVIYEVPQGNIGHDELFELLSKDSNKKLFYDSDKFKCYAFQGNSVNDALFSDLQNIVIPFVNETAAEEIKAMIQEAYKKRMA